MAEISEFKENIQQEEVQYKASVSEATNTKIGGSINFINNRQYDTHSFNLNGPYELGVGSTGLDGKFIVLRNMELVAISFSNKNAGASGTTTVDIHWFNASGSDQGTIFSTKPAISSAAPDDAYGVKGIATGYSDFTGTGITLPVLSKTTFDAGDALDFQLDASMSAPQDFNLNIHFRPIN